MTKQHPAWSPYDNNGGTCVAIAGADYCVIAADTRMSTGYSILTRDYSKICKLADKCVMASSGFQADVKALQKLLAARHLIYQHQHNKQMSCPGMAQLLSNTLYYKRFFPYYSFNVLGGLDNEGKDFSNSHCQLLSFFFPFLVIVNFLFLFHFREGLCLHI
ncbi:proteasome subunit beta type-1 [Citrus sinensis]|uniref:Proteasome subunit beta type-1 n=1 Tax=Citrus sinensis TaxID=2711 RepID=A0ACB8MRV0_CITSI|nr:proteasome subunit beta type-1 [Citrus sinensis]KAH9788286.1 proteasome subunit beta type-1 [Citrus sinensis]